MAFWKKLSDFAHAMKCVAVVEMSGGNFHNSFIYCFLRYPGIFRICQLTNKFNERILPMKAWFFQPFPIRIPFSSNFCVLVSTIIERQYYHIDSITFTDPVPVKTLFLSHFYLCFLPSKISRQKKDTIIMISNKNCSALYFAAVLLPSNWK